MKLWTDPNREQYERDLAEKYGQGCRCGLDAALKEIGV